MKLALSTLDPELKSIKRQMLVHLSSPTKIVEGMDFPAGKRGAVDGSPGVLSLPIRFRR